MSLLIVTMWRCDVCGATAPERANGWVDATSTHGCPDHAAVVAAHAATLDSQYLGQRRAPLWVLRCACGWRPTSWWHHTELLKAEYRVHVRAEANGGER